MESDLAAFEYPGDPEYSPDCVDEVPLNLHLARHHLQRLGLTARHNLRYVRASIVHHLDHAEALLAGAEHHPLTHDYRRQIAAVRKELERVPV